MLALVLSLASCAQLEALAFSGLPKSADAPAFRPSHLNGPFQGETVCPICTNGNDPQVQVWAAAEYLEEGLRLTRTLADLVPSDAGASLPAYLVVLGGDAKALERRLSASGDLPVMHVATLAAADAALYNIASDCPTRTTVHWITSRRVFERDVDLDPEQARGRFEGLWPELRRFSEPYEATQYYIAPPWEPGEKLVITGRVLGADGEAITGRKLRAWQTDARGLYNDPDNGRREPTLTGLLWTGEDGSYRWETIKPAPYPSGLEPAHIHMGLDREDGESFWRTLWFEGDPLLSAEKRRWAAGDRETVIIPLRREGETWRGAHDIVVDSP